MSVLRVLNLLVRLGGTAALLLGLALWGGRLTGLLSIHMLLGVVVVLGLWGLAVMAWRQGARGLAGLGLVWGLATLGLGPSQTRILVGEHHWIVQVAHLLLGLGAIALGAVLARRARTA
jgi:hypothetical protein